MRCDRSPDQRVWPNRICIPEYGTHNKKNELVWNSRSLQAQRGRVRNRKKIKWIMVAGNLRWTDGQMTAWEDGWMDGWMDTQINGPSAQ